MLEFDFGAAKQSSRLGFAGDVGQFDVFRLSVQHMNINGIPGARAGDGLGWFPRSATRAVNTLAIFSQPVADLLQYFNLTRFNASIGHPADIQQKISIPSGTFGYNMTS